ncbi:hypothetical protein QQL38_07275 [Pseudomonas syringae]|uniref:hypothetical protein n=1 Tax=Pseudomonas syringae group TaxID=136849 RepID=UPI0008F39AC4|nr:hypothetical protein [Pseudomonas syringae]MBD8567880.1 hypothetical protein [Pseudomonas syringae]MCL6306313.1 hypothetical protein [Pseudomonas syringae]MEE4084824.1 hypothetical protein [Pseudomonas viridiflava]SFH49235.1 hypothetical protein SAMN05444507_101252 [Pseudomonas syringae]
MSNTKITVPSEYAESLLNLIEQRIREIGKKYHANGQSYRDDLEIAAFRAIAQQLGYDFEALSGEGGFSTTRHVYSPSSD